MKKPFKLTLCLLLLAFAALGRGEVEKEKLVEASYPVAASDQVVLSNKYGTITVRTWDKNEIVCKATIKAWGRNEKIAQELLDQIEVEHEKSGGTIRFETLIDKRGDKGSSYNQGFEINYQISMPATPALRLSNKFGAVAMGDYSGRLEAEVRHGGFRAVRLTGAAQKNVDVAFGSVDIEEVTAGQLVVKHGSAKVGRMDKGYLEVQHGSLTLDQGGQVETNVKHGSTDIGTVSRLKSASGFGSFSVRKLQEAAVVESKHGSCDIEGIAEGFERIEVEATFGSVTLRFEDKAAFTFEVDVKFGRFRSALDGLDIQRESDGTNSYEASGKRGAGSGSVSIANTHGAVRFR